jgi:hypothetical protein
LLFGFRRWRVHFVVRFVNSDYGVSRNAIFGWTDTVVPENLGAPSNVFVLDVLFLAFFVAIVGNSENSWALYGAVDMLDEIASQRTSEWRRKSIPAGPKLDANSHLARRASV